MSTTNQSRFLTSNASDFAKMLQTVGVDRVIAVDLQRPGQVILFPPKALFTLQSLYFPIVGT